MSNSNSEFREIQGSGGGGGGGGARVRGKEREGRRGRVFFRFFGSPQGLVIVIRIYRTWLKSRSRGKKRPSSFVYLANKSLKEPRPSTHNNPTPAGRRRGAERPPAVYRYRPGSWAVVLTPTGPGRRQPPFCGRRQDGGCWYLLASTATRRRSQDADRPSSSASVFHRLLSLRLSSSPRAHLDG